MQKNETVAAFFIGNEVVAMEMAVKVKNQFAGDTGDIVSVSDAESMKRELLYAPFFGHKAVSISSRKFSAVEVNALLSIIDCVPSECMLVVGGPAIPKKIMRGLSKVGEPKIRLMEYGVFTDATAAAAFVCKRVVDKGAKISSGAARRLVSIVGLDCGFLEGEINKLLIVTDSIEEDHVELYAFPSSSAEFYRLYSYLGDADVTSAIEESRSLVRRFDIAAVDMAIMKVACICVRLATSSFTGCIDVRENRFNSRWWDGKGPGKGKPVPSSFMVDIARKICDRHQNGVKYLLKRVSSGFSMHRTTFGMPEVVLEAKILAMCGRG